MNRLLGRVTALREGSDVPRIVILRGESGLGKSRIIREFYREMVAQQPKNRLGFGYWPDPPEATVVHADGTPVIDEMDKRRKWIGPLPHRMSRPAGTLPGFYWWSMHCQTETTLVDVSAQLLAQLSPHLEYLADRWRQEVALPDRAVQLAKEARDDARALARALGEDVALESLGVAMGAFGLAAPGLGILTSHLWEGAIAIRKRRRHTADLSRGGPLTLQQSGPGEILQSLSRFAGPHMPVILAVEDLHMMGEDLAELLSLLCQPEPEFPVLVVATAWGSGSHPVYTDWLDAVRAGPGLVEVRQVPTLTQGDRAALAARFAPTVGLPAVAEVARAYPNPWALTMAMEHPRVGGRLRAGGQVGAGDLAALPKHVSHWYQLLWNDLPDPVQTTLRLAGVTATAPDFDQSGATQPVYAEALVQAGDAAQTPVDASTVAEAVDPHSWLEYPDSARSQVDFVDYFHARIARDEGDDRLEEGQRAAARRTVQDFAEQVLLSRASDENAYLEPGVRLAAASLLARTAAAGARQVDTQALLTAVRAQSRARGAVLDSMGAIRAWDDHYSPSQLNWDDPLTVRDLHALAQQCWRAGSFHAEDKADWDPDEAASLRRRAIALLTDVVAHRDQDPGPTVDITIATRWELAHWHAEVFDFERATVLGEAVLEKQHELGRWRDELVLNQRHEVAHWYSHGGDAETARAILGAEVNDLQDLAGPDSSSTLNSLTCLAQVTEQAGDYHEAIDLAKDAVARSSQALGYDHPVTVRAHTILAATLHTNRDLAAAQDAARNILNLWEEIRKHSLGELAHRIANDIAATHTLLAEVSLELGDAEEAVRQSAIALTEAARALGPDEWTTLRATEYLGTALAAAGRTDQSVLWKRELLSRYERVFGPDNPDTVDVRNDLERARLLHSLRTPTALRLMIAEAGLEPTSAGDAVSFALARGFIDDQMITLIGASGIHGREAIVSQGLQLSPPHHVAVRAFLDLMGSGYDPWRVLGWFQWETAARAAAVTAVEEDDADDLAGLMALSQKLRDSATADALFLLIATGSGPQRVTLSHPVKEVADALDRLEMQVHMSPELRALSRRVANDIRAGRTVRNRH